MWDRRRFLTQSLGAVGAAFIGLRTAHASAPVDTRSADLRADPAGLLDLAEGFSYRIISRSGEEMADGLRVPGGSDGMAAFAGEDGRIILVRNHELERNSGARFGTAFDAGDVRLPRIERARLYDAGDAHPAYGGTTTLIYDPMSARVEAQFMSLGGTLRNCAGGTTPWQSWLSCEESLQRATDGYRRDHGYVFEVPIQHRGLIEAQPLKSMGRFLHEAAAVDPRTGIVYLTEDRADGLFYRLLPNEHRRLAAGGRLQALALIDDPQCDTRHWQETRLRQDRRYAARWIDLDGVDSLQDDLRRRGYEKGAALFARGEGLWCGRNGIYFACTSGGRLQAGQIFCYQPSPDEGHVQERDQPGMLSLFVESQDPERFQHVDNLTIAPWGDLFACEDASRPCAIVRIRPDGQCLPFARYRPGDSEPAGACFAPDGKTLFVNVQWAGLTLAITGPFARFAVEH